jgi:large subunit ribosomal protein L1
VQLPHGSGKKVRVIVFTERPEEAIKAGASAAGLEDLMEKVTGGWFDFDVAVATTAAMKEVRKVARVLGPKGLMPNPKNGTVGDDVPAIIKQLQAGRVEFKMDKTANMGVVVGKRSFKAEAIAENAAAVLEAVGKAKPDAVGQNKLIKSMTLASTMSPGVKIDSSVYGKY